MKHQKCECAVESDLEKIQGLALDGEIMLRNPLHH